MMKNVSHDIGIGDLLVAASGDDLKTYALGSCVAVVVWDVKVKAGGMIHIALPEARINPEKALTTPGYFADTGLPKFFEELARLGASRGTSWVKIVGGASFFDTRGLFDVGGRNLAAVKDYIEQAGLAIAAEDTGGSTSRTVALSLSTGQVTISNGGRRWNL